MLKFLSIRNFALIDRLEVEFKEGFSLFTGETGSGKSILVDAVGLLVGERASQECVREGFDQARLEGIFSLSPDHAVRPQLEQAQIPLENDELIIRREISLSGNNKVFINGVLSTQTLLAHLGTLLADIHGQHDQQLLLRPATQLEFLDAFGGNHLLVREVADLYARLRSLRSELECLKARDKERLQRLDLLRFQLADIEKLQLRPGLDHELEEERKLLATAEKRLQTSQEAYQALYEREESCLALLNRVEKQVEELAALDEKFQPLRERLRDLRYQLEEIAYQLRDYSCEIEFNPARLETLEERLAEIGKGRRKYGQSVNEILAYAQQISREIEALSREETRIEELSLQEREVAEQYLEQARKLSAKRRKDGESLQQAMETELAELSMENTIYIAEVRSSEQRPTAKGIDEVEFLISPNLGEVPKPLARIASGGELSRAILALKSILTLEDYPKTLVFDEVDAGIGGRVASRVGEKLARLARQHQVFCVTHLPQIASYARQHFHVDKSRRGRRTIVQIKPLNQEGRLEEMARMMAGSAVTDTTRKQARELLERAKESVA